MMGAPGPDFGTWEVMRSMYRTMRLVTAEILDKSVVSKDVAEPAAHNVSRTNAGFSTESAFFAWDVAFLVLTYSISTK
jgi:hypothetical protein